MAQLRSDIAALQHEQNETKEALSQRTREKDQLKLELADMRSSTQSEVD